MDNDSTRQTRQHLSRTLFCGHCKHSNLLIWEASRSAEAPPQSATMDGLWYAVHCDYFKRRLEHPDRLRQCGAYRRRHDPRTPSSEPPTSNSNTHVETASSERDN